MTSQQSPQIPHSATFQIATNELVKEFSPQSRALDGVSIGVHPGEFFALLGPSGCGKSTLLRCLAGLESPTAGHIIIDGQDVTTTDPGKRGIAMVFQDYALFPGMTVAQNVTYALRLHRQGKTAQQRSIERFASGLDLGGLLDRYPSELSGGQQQRVAIARAMAARPRVLLLDEPLSNLDARLRIEARTLLKRFQQETKVTTILVTHDQSEALAMADRMAVMDRGGVQQVGTPYEIYHHPRNSFVATFIGMYPTNLVEGIIDGDRIRVAGGELPNRADVANSENQSISNRGRILVGVRPEYLSWHPDGNDNPCSSHAINVTVALVENAGASSILHVKPDGGATQDQHLLRTLVSSDDIPQVGEHGTVWCREDKILMFDAVTGEALNGFGADR